MGHVGTDLVGTTRNQLHLQKADDILPFVAGAENAVFRDDLLSAGEGLVTHLHGIADAVLAQVPRKGSAVAQRLAVNQAEIALAQAVVADIGIHHPQGLGVLSGNDHPSRITVNTVTQGGRKGLLVGRNIVPLGGEVSLDVHDQGILPALGIIMHQHAGALVEEHNMLVLIYDVQLGGNGGKG